MSGDLFDAASGDFGAAMSGDFDIASLGLKILLSQLRICESYIALRLN